MTKLNPNPGYIFLFLTSLIGGGCKTHNPLISSAFPFESKYLEINGNRMHYVEEGAGDPILFLHGVPMSSYAWRNIIPHLSDAARCVAIDFMGFGQ